VRFRAYAFAFLGLGVGLGWWMTASSAGKKIDS
jgi:hypothetical protein